MEYSLTEKEESRADLRDSHLLHAWDSDGVVTRFATATDCRTYWQILEKLDRLPVWKTLADFLPNVGKRRTG